jgi:hypothetical protein
VATGTGGRYAGAFTAISAAEAAPNQATETTEAMIKPDGLYTAPPNRIEKKELKTIESVKIDK